MIVKIASLAAAAVLIVAVPALAFDPESEFAAGTWAISAQTVWSHYGPRMGNDGAVVQSWNLSAEAAMLPFGVIGHEFMGGALEGAPEIGLAPLFEHFQTLDQNFGGLGLKLRYYWIRYRVGRLVPWIEASATPGGTDLRVPYVPGPFMFVIEGGLGLSYFLSERVALYFGYQIQHISNAWTHRDDRGLNSPAGVVIGVSWFLR